MKFSFFMMPLHVPSENPSLAFQRDIDMIVRADDLGYDEFYIGEHHSAGWETMPAPEIALAKASALAPRIRLGTAVISLPFHHPFHVAERMAFLDHLTRGRAVLGVGPCGLSTDAKLFDVPGADLRGMMNESVDIIAKLLESAEPITYEGKYWQLRDMALQLRSYQQPRLPLAVATTGSPGSVDMVAKYQMMMFSLAAPLPPRSYPLAQQWSKVEEAAEKHGTRVDRDNWRVVTYIYLADTREQAWADVEAGIQRDVHQYFYTINGPQMWVTAPDQKPEDLTPREIATHRRWIIGTPDDAIEAIERLYEECGGFGGLMMTTHEWVPQQKINYSLELFARYVIPHFRGHSADLQRSWQRAQTARKAGALPPLGGPPQAAPSLKDHRSNLYVNR